MLGRLQHEPRSVSSPDHESACETSARASEAYGIAVPGYKLQPSSWRNTTPWPRNCASTQCFRCKLRRTLGGPSAHRRNAALALSLAGLLALVATGCGGSDVQQDAKEPKGDFPVKVVSATFPGNQRLAKDSTMEIVVQNAGQKTIPTISVTVKCGKGLGGSFSTKTAAPNVADPQRPQFVVTKIPTATERVNPPLDPAPLERSSAFVDTYPLGPLAAGRSATFRWDVSAVKAGPYRLCWRVNAGLFGKARAVPAQSGAISGVFSGEVSNKAPTASIGPDGQTVIEQPGN
jgi:hypothetical protein